MSFSEVAWNKFGTFKLQVWFPEGQISETEVEKGIDALRQKRFSIEYFYSDLEREIYKGVIDERFSIRPWNQDLI